MIKAKYIDNSGFQYKSKRSKNSEVKKSFSNTVVVKKSPVIETSTHISYKNDQYSVVYNKKNGMLSISKIISKSLNKYGKEITLPILSEVTEGVTIENIASFV